MRPAVLACCAALALLALVATPARADVYINSPRGSNNRLDEANRDRDNGDRLFDSQNNDRGGYNVGNVYYYTGSTVSIEWTAQHSCGDKTRANCEIVLQYSCDDRLRDGTTTTTIPDNPNQCYNYDCDTDLRYGRHESFSSYSYCQYTTRNKGLWTANQNLKGDAQKYTRQNPGGTRRGLECPEERDYYPYWQPTVWRDIAILTNDPLRCAAYQAESQNVKEKFYCSPPEALMAENVQKGREGWIPITQEACERLSFKDNSKNATFHGKWMARPAWGLPAPECRENQWSRDNHHGNVADSGFTATYNWTVPTALVHERCALRLRYNISTADTVNWESDTVQAGFGGDFLANSDKKNPTANKDPARLDVWTQYGLNYTDVADSFKGLNPDDATAMKGTREYVMKNNPRVDAFGPLLPAGSQSFLKTQLAINTAQYGRTFQDRSHRFAIRARPASIPADATIHNVQVRGKRGNIVQVYPGVEYDMTPNRLNMQQGDYVHFQWTGSNTNPQNNAGNGLAGTDRSNLVVQRGPNYDDSYAVTSPPTKGVWGNSYPGRVDESVRFMGLSPADLIYLGTLQSIVGMDIAGAQFGGHMDQFDDAGTYFDLGPRQVTQAGIYHYVSTRNNAFSNRSQKGKIVVSAVAAKTEAIGVNGGVVHTAGAQAVRVPAGALRGLQMVTAAVTPRDSPDTAGPSDHASDFVEVQFNSDALVAGQAIEVTLNYDNPPLHKASIKRASSITAGDWQSASGSMSGGQATIHTTEPGVFAVTSKLDIGAVVGIAIGCAVFIALVAFIVFKVWRRNKSGHTVNNSAASAAPAVTMTQV